MGITGKQMGITESCVFDISRQSMKHALHNIVLVLTLWCLAHMLAWCMPYLGQYFLVNSVANVRLRSYLVGTTGWYKFMAALTFSIYVYNQRCLALVPRS